MSFYNQTHKPACYKITFRHKLQFFISKQVRWHIKNKRNSALRPYIVHHLQCYITCSVPQGSVSGPLLFIVYTADLTTIAEKHGVSLHAFADDTHLYLHCRHGDTASVATQLERCISDVELLWVGLRHSLHQHDLCLPELHLGHDSVVARDHVRLLGATISSGLSLDQHVSIISLLLTSAIVAMPAFTQHAVSSDARPFIRVITCRHTVMLFWRVCWKWRLTSFNE